MCTKEPVYPKMDKITDLIASKGFTYSFEVTQDTPFDKINALTSDPAFFSVTWHAKSHGGEHLEIRPLKLARYLKSKGKTVCMHMSCDLLRKEYLDKVLVDLQRHEICNLFVVLGENYEGSKSDFKSSKQLVEYIKKQTGDYFCIGVAGYPGIPDHLKELQEKVERGADFIITQAFEKYSTFEQFEENCQQLNITVPIIPGIFLYDQFKEYQAFANLCKINISNEMLEYKNDEHFTGIGLHEKLLLKILNSESGMHHVHFFTMNKFDLVENFLKEIKEKTKEEKMHNYLRN